MQRHTAPTITVHSFSRTTPPSRSSISERLYRDSKSRAEKLEAQRIQFLRQEQEKLEQAKSEGLKATAEINRGISRRNFQVLYSDSFQRREKREAEKARALATEQENMQKEISRIFPTRTGGSATPQNLSRASFLISKENSRINETPVVERLLAAKEIKEQKIERMKKQLEMEEAAKIEATRVARLPKPKEDRAKAEMYLQVLGSHRRSKSLAAGSRLN